MGANALYIICTLLVSNFDTMVYLRLCGAESNMLNIYFRHMPEAIYNTAVYFKNTHRDSWITNPLSVEMIRNVDKSEVVSASVIESPVLGSITPGRQIDLTWPKSYNIVNSLRLCVRIDLRGDAVVGRKSSNETTKPSDRDAAIYVRISLDQGMGELALDRQEKECRDRAARDGVEVRQERVYSDLSISAADARKRRPAYERLLADVCAGEVGRVYVWDLDRLTRQPMLTFTTIQIHVPGAPALTPALGRYEANGRPAVLLYEVEPEDEFDDGLWCDLTVNLPEQALPGED